MFVCSVSCSPSLAWSVAGLVALLQASVCQVSQGAGLGRVLVLEQLRDLYFYLGLGLDGPAMPVIDLNLQREPALVHSRLDVGFYLTQGLKSSPGC